MGKIFTRIMPGLGASSPNGIDFYILEQIFNALSGTTTITKIGQDPSSYSFLIEAENDQFLDGTEIVPNWTTGYQNTGGFSSGYTVFKGIAVIDPQTQGMVGSPSTGNFSSGGGVVTITAPGISGGGSYHYFIGGGGAGSATPAIPPYKALTGIQPPSDDDAVLKDDADACVCGAGSVGGAHSSWCSKK